MDALAIITTISTIVLTGITGYYAWQTRILTKETHDARELATLPVLTCTMMAHAPTGTKVAGKQGDVYGELNSLEVRNVGTGPALDVHIQIETVNAQRSVLRLNDTSIDLHTLGIENRTIDLHPAMFYPAGSEDAVLSIRVTYRNIYGRELSTTAKICMAPSLPPANQWYWKTIDEQVNLQATSGAISQIESGPN
jgi:hypothetical protein